MFDTDNNTQAQGTSSSYGSQRVPAGYLNISVTDDNGKVNSFNKGIPLFKEVPLHVAIMQAQEATAVAVKLWEDTDQTSPKPELNLNLNSSVYIAGTAKAEDYAFGGK